MSRVLKDKQRSGKKGEMDCRERTWDVGSQERTGYTEGAEGGRGGDV